MVVVTSDVVVLTPVVWIQKWTVITSTVPPSHPPPPPPPPPPQQSTLAKQRAAVVVVLTLVVWIQKWTVITSTPSIPSPLLPPQQTTLAMQRAAVVVVSSDDVVLALDGITSTLPLHPLPSRKLWSSSGQQSARTETAPTILPAADQRGVGCGGLATAVAGSTHHLHTLPNNPLWSVCGWCLPITYTPSPTTHCGLSVGGVYPSLTHPPQQPTVVCLWVVSTRHLHTLPNNPLWSVCGWCLPITYTPSLTTHCGLSVGGVYPSLTHPP